MKVIEYIGEVLSDGHISLPDEVREELGVDAHSRVKVSLAVQTSPTPDEQKGWEVFKHLGKDAIEGQLSNASTNHDRYLYGDRT